MQFMERWTSSMIVLATMAIGCGSSDRKPLMLMTQAAAPKCAAPSGDTEVDKICKPKMNSGVKVGFLMGLATKDQCLDGPAASAAVPGKAKPAVVPPIP